MPGKDRTGPNGQGPFTGRGYGPCGCGMRRGFGKGYGFRNRMSLTQEEEKEILEAEIKEIDLMKQGIEKRLKELN